MPGCGWAECWIGTLRLYVPVFGILDGKTGARTLRFAQLIYSRSVIAL